MDLFVSGDLCSTLALLGILGFVGTWMVGRHDSLRTCGLRLGAGAFIGVASHEAVRSRASSADTLLPVALESLIVAGFVVAGSWTILPLLACVHDHTLAVFLSRIRVWRWAWIGRARERRLRREQERKRCQAAEQQRRLAPEWERQAREEEARQRTCVEAQRRRDDARARVELAYNLLAPQLGERCSRELFGDYCERFLNDGLSPQAGKGPVGSESEAQMFVELTQDFERQRQEVEASNVDDKLKRIILLKLRESLINKITHRSGEDS